MLMVLLVSCIPLSTLTVVPIANATTDSLIQVSDTVLPPYTVDFTPYMMELGYTEKEISELPEQEYVRILLTDGGRINIDVNMEEICQNLFGNSTGPVPAPGLDKYIDSTIGSEEEQSDFSSRLPLSKACFIVAIWNYSDATMNQYQMANSYSSLLPNVNNYGIAIIMCKRLQIVLLHTLTYINI